MSQPGGMPPRRRAGRRATPEPSVSPYVHEADLHGARPYRWRGQPGWRPELVEWPAHARSVARQVRETVIALQAEAARRCGLDHYPRDLIRMSEAYGRHGVNWPGVPIE